MTTFVPADYRPRPVLPTLDEGFFDLVEPALFPESILRFRNNRWAGRVGLSDLSDAEWLSHFALFDPLPGNLRQPHAMRYHGHQFQVYNPYLGDGRGFTFAQLADKEDSRLLDLGTKGSGETPWSRDGDGRLTLKGAVREALATEMLEALGVYTSKTFSIVETGEELYRGDEPSPTRSAVLVRLSHSHIRIGTFQRFAHHRDAARLKRLLDFCIEHYLPKLATAESTPIAFLRKVVHRIADLTASYIAAGFVHGVLNTDNINITGESFDYGPWRFAPTFDRRFTAAYFDKGGLYAFGRQPAAMLWNLQQLAAALMDLAPFKELLPVLDEFQPSFAERLNHRVFERLGLRFRPDGADLVAALYAFLEQSKAGYDQFFFDWYGGLASEQRAIDGPAAALYQSEAFRPVRKLLARFSPVDPDRLSNAYFDDTRPCRMLFGDVEALWVAIADRDDWRPFDTKIAEVRAMGAALGLKPRAEGHVPL